MSLPEPLERLSACLGRLPGVGRRSAERMAVRLVREREGLLTDLINALGSAKSGVRCCSLCGSVTPVDEEPCKLCTGANRDGSLLCVVEDPADIATIEKSGGFHGRYHALMGRLSPMKGEGAADLRLKQLLERVDREKYTEVILALGTDVEGDSTASLVIDLLKNRKVKITRLAFGLPAGSGILYSDPVTLARAIKGRTVE